MPFYNTIPDWNGLDIEIHPTGRLRKIFRFWPFFVGQNIQLELVVKKPATIEKSELLFHLVERIDAEDKPRIVTLILLPELSTQREKVFSVSNGSRITGKGEIRYWVSNRGYNVENEPVFSTEAVSLDSLIIPIMLMILGPILGFLGGLILGLSFGG